MTLLDIYLLMELIL